MQGFEWHVPADQLHWQRLRKAIPDLKDIGIDNIWIPPGCKGMDPTGSGYDIYDLYDLGEFDQKGSRATRWGPKEDLEDLVYTAQEWYIGIYWDTVLNQKAGADSTESFAAVKVDPEGMTSPPERISVSVPTPPSCQIEIRTSLSPSPSMAGLALVFPAAVASTVR